MYISRRFFIGGATAFGACGAFDGNRLFASPAGRAAGKAPNLTFGVVSDIHIEKTGEGERIESWRNNLTFRRALEWFRDQGVDAVVVAGDMTNYGTVEELEAVAQAWYSVFPGDRYPDGRPVEKVFVLGNHDFHGFLYGGNAAKLYPDEAERARHVLRADFAGFWRRVFHEDYVRFYRKTVKGYEFLGQHWDDGSGMGGGFRDGESGPGLQAFLNAHGRAIDPARPFFYVQHPHPKDTCYGPWAWGHDKGMVTNILSAWPNAVAFSGHSHYTLTDERSVWQGGFTSVGTSSLRYSGLPYNARLPGGYENSETEGRGAWKLDAAKMMPRLASGDSRQGMLWRVYDDRMVVQRREFLAGLDLGDDWVFPLPSAEPRPFAFAARAQKAGAPEFPAGAVLAVSAVKAKNRGGVSGDGKTKLPSEEKAAVRVEIPAASAGRARSYEFEVVATSKSNAEAQKSKFVLAEGFNMPPTHKKTSAPTPCVFALDELPAGDVRFVVTPIGSFGNRGKALAAEWSRPPVA